MLEPSRLKAMKEYYSKEPTSNAKDIMDLILEVEDYRKAKPCLDVSSDTSGEG